MDRQYPLPRGCYSPWRDGLLEVEAGTTSPWSPNLEALFEGLSYTTDDLAYIAKVPPEFVGKFGVYVSRGLGTPLERLV